jgi:hypothetical protein
VPAFYRRSHALLRKLLYAPMWLPELLGVASACQRPEGLGIAALQIGARASDVFRSLGTRLAKPLRRAILTAVSCWTDCCCSWLCSPVQVPLSPCHVLNCP